MLNELGIKGRILLLSLLPTCVMAMVLGGYFSWVQLSDMRTVLEERGQLIAEQLGPLAAPALLRDDRVLLQRIAQDVLDQADVRAVEFISADQKILAHAGPRMTIAIRNDDGETASLRSGLDVTHFHLPVQACLLYTSPSPRD